MERPELSAKRVSESAIYDGSNPIMPNDLNSLGTLFGGTLLKKADLTAGDTANRHTKTLCVTTHVEGDFINPGYLGETLIYKSSVNRTWRSSMLEVGVKVLAFNYMEDSERHIASFYFILVAIEKTKKNEIKLNPVVPEVIPETEDQQRRYKEAEERRRYRHEIKKRKPST
ncbi:MAG: hotdog domain-containing protein [bacterium]|nr:hotdog domain-containing protein [bacterium]